MVKSKTYKNGLRLIVNTSKNLFSVSIGVLVGTGSRNESENENGLSHFIEHTLFKGTEKRSAFEISDYIDSIGAQINAFTSKEMTCFYTKSIREHAEESLEVLSDIFFNSKFDEKELEKEKGVVIEEINMCEDSPEDVCLDILEESAFGKEGLGQTILGSVKNVKSFTKKDIERYMDKYYTADNVVISICGNLPFEDADKMVSNLFLNGFNKRLKHAKYNKFNGNKCGALKRVKKTEQTHIGFSFPAFSIFDERGEALSIANAVLGGGMSSRLFQKIREEMGLCYSIYSYPSAYNDCGVVEVYAGVKKDERDLAVHTILTIIKDFYKNGITEKEFLRGKEQIKSSFILGKESSASLMLLYGKYLLFFNEIFDFKKKLSKLQKISKQDVDDVIKTVFSIKNISTATLGTKKTALKI